MRSFSYSSSGLAGRDLRRAASDVTLSATRQGSTATVRAALPPPWKDPARAAGSFARGTLYTAGGAHIVPMCMRWQGQLGQSVRVKIAPRPLNSDEHAVLDLLLFVDFDGATDLRAQARDATVIGRCDCGCPTVDLAVPDTAPAADLLSRVSRVQINKAMVGFLTHTGFSHGGNGFEGMAFLLDRFAAVDVGDPADPNHGLDLRAMATAYAREYKHQKAQAKELGAGGPPALPGVHHPVFKGKPVNYDPREQFVATTMADRGEYNIFHDYYRELVQALFDVGASPYVFCINVDGMIAAMLLALLWPDYQSGRITEQELETAAFTVFLLGRMMGAAAEIDDHLNRGRNMDTRTPASRCKFVT